MRLRAMLPPLQTLTPSEGRRFRAWLGALEALARKAVLIQAAAISPTLAPSRPRTAPARRSKRTPRQPRLRLWPRLTLRQRITALGPPVSVREIWRARRRAALVARLAAARGKRKPAHIRLADRLDALERLIAAPAAAALRLARKLVRAPALAGAIAAAPQAEARCVEPELVHAVCRQGLVAAFGDTS